MRTGGKQHLCLSKLMTKLASEEGQEGYNVVFLITESEKVKQHYRIEIMLRHE